MSKPIRAAAGCRILTLLVLTGSTWAADEYVNHPVQRGDTLIGLRDQLLQPGARWQELQRINKVSNPRRLVPGSQLRIPLALMRTQPVPAEVLHAHGDVTVQRGQLAPLALAGGDRLQQGDLVRTGSQSSVTVRFDDGSRVLLRPGSELRIERSVRLGRGDSVDSRVRLQQGGADSRVAPQAAPHFEVITPVANLGVRGTEFRTRADARQTAVEVLEGRVAADGTLVNAGLGLLATAQQRDPPRPLLAAPELPGVPSLIQRMPLRLGWKGPAGAANYRAQVFSADGTDALLLDGMFDTATARWSEDLPDGRYVLRVRSVDAGGLEGRDASAAFTIKARPEPPFLSRPRGDEKTADERVLFAWTRQAAAARYRLQVADNAEFAAPRVDRSDLETTELAVALPTGTHHWRLASIRADGDIGPFSDAQTVIRVQPPPAPAADPPAVTPDGILLRWRNDGAAGYQIQMARDAAFTQLLADETVQAPQWLLRQPSPGTYHFRVRARDADGFLGPFGAVQQLDVPHSRWWWLLLPAALLLL